MDGQPLVGAQVLFTPTAPADGSTYSGTQSAGFTNAEGKYQLESYNAGAGAVVGVHKIMITQTADTPGAAAKIDPSLASVSEDLPANVAAAAGLIPARYNSATKLSFEVPAAGTDQANFDLNSK
jgi:hypothetical protein